MTLLQAPERLDQQFGARTVEPFQGARLIGTNRVLFKPEVACFPEDFRLRGEDNVVRVDANSDLSRLRIYVRGRKQRILIGAACVLKGAIFIAGSSNIVVRIGDGTTFAHTEIYCAENAGVTIGADCMFSRAVEIRTSDAHGIYDATTRERTNPARPVEIGDHVWIGLGVCVSKGARVPSGCVIGANSFVNGRFEETGVIIAGAPARIVRRNILWDRGREPRL